MRCAVPYLPFKYLEKWFIYNNKKLHVSLFLGKSLSNWVRKKVMKNNLKYIELILIAIKLKFKYNSLSFFIFRHTLNNSWLLFYSNFNKINSLHNNSLQLFYIINNI
jgi:hypothetical protein